VASAQDVEGAIRSLMEALAGATPDPASIPDRTIVCVIPDLKTAFSAKMKKAKLVGLKEVEPGESADVRITARSDDLIALIERRLNVGFAFLTGKVRVDASAQDLMLLRRLF
jgi:hypothetical protein